MNKLLGLLLGVILLPTLVLAGEGVMTGPAGSPYNGIRNQTFTSSGTFIPTTPVIYVSGCGGGGGGAGGFNNATGGGGGGGSGAACVADYSITVVPGNTLTITIGTAGVGGAINTNGGVTNVNTTIAGLPIGTLTIMGGGTAATAGTAANGGNGGGVVNQLGGGAGGVGAGAAGNGATRCNPTATTCDVHRDFPGYFALSTGAGGGGTNAGTGVTGGASLHLSPYGTNGGNVNGGAGSGASGGGGGGGSSHFGVGGTGGSAGPGTACSIGYGAGGGGGAANQAGGNGCPGVLWIRW